MLTESQSINRIKYHSSFFLYAVCSSLFVVASPREKGDRDQLLKMGEENPTKRVNLRQPHYNNVPLVGNLTKHYHSTVPNLGTLFCSVFRSLR